MAREAVLVNVVLMLAGILLMAMGAAEILGWAGLRGQRDKKLCRGQTVVLVLPKGPEDCECLVRYAGENARWSGGCRFICVVRDPESRDIAGKLSERYKGLEVCGPGELEKLLGAGAGL